MISGLLAVIPHDPFIAQLSPTRDLSKTHIQDSVSEFLALLGELPVTLVSLTGAVINAGIATINIHGGLVFIHTSRLVGV